MTGLLTHYTHIDFAMDGMAWDRDAMVTYEYEPAEGASAACIYIAKVEVFYLAGREQKSLDILPSLPPHIARDLALRLKTELEALA